jgi:alkylation response protein AidB-like acyl-CoA dehydrogenase
MARGEAVAAFALSEPEAGSDPASLQLEAKRDGDGWLLSGEKIWISNAPDADVYTLFARTDPDAGARGVSAFCVRGDADGLSGEPIDMLAPHPIGRLLLDGVRVSDADLLGEENRGFRVAMKTLDLFRPSVGAFAVGMAQAALDLAVAHASERIQFGQPIYDFQAVAHPLADAATAVQASRLLVYAAASAYDGTGRADTRASAMAKLFATESAQVAVDAAVQVVGARALVKDHPLERLYREVRAPRIYEGTSEIQRTIIARELRRDLEEGRS